MGNNWLLRAATFLFVIFLLAALAWLTLAPPDDPCAAPRLDVGAAVLADRPADQEALVNRAIIMRGDCKGDARYEHSEGRQDQ